MSIKGMDKLIRKLNSLGGNAERAVTRAVHKTTNKVQGDAKDLAPVALEGGGRLRDSIKKEVTENQGEVTGRVSTNVEYAAYVEFGTGQRGQASPAPPKAPLKVGYRQDWSGMQAQPYMYPAAAQNKDTLSRYAEEELKKEIKKLEG